MTGIEEIDILNTTNKIRTLCRDEEARKGSVFA